MPVPTTLSMNAVIMPTCAPSHQPMEPPIVAPSTASVLDKALAGLTCEVAQPYRRRRLVATARRECHHGANEQNASPPYLVGGHFQPRSA